MAPTLVHYVWPLPPEGSFAPWGGPAALISMKRATCPLCQTPGGTLIHQTPRWRVVRADEETDFPAFYRVVWTPHVAEFSELTPAHQVECMRAVAAVEVAMREQLQPAKVNIASLGNVVPHLHWHVIARFAWDNRFPSPVWAQAQRSSDAQRIQAIIAQRPALEQAMLERLQLLNTEVSP